MNLKTLQKEMILAMKNKDKNRKDALSFAISSIKNAAIDKKIDKENIPDSIVDEVLLKQVKTVKEQIDNCPASREDLLSQYEYKLSVLNKFAPKLIVDANEIKTFIWSLGIDVSNKNRGLIMKNLKGKVDMKIANDVLKELLK